MLQTPLTCSAALKEWAVAIEALGEGRQALIIRKGGIREDNGHFEVKFPEFLLFPSFEHQQADLLRPEYAQELGHALNAAPDSDSLTFTHFATVHKAFPVTEAVELQTLAPHHIWTQEYAEKRLRWKPKVALTAMVLRVYALPEPARVPIRPEYAGCKSWLQLLDTVTVDAVVPAMPDDAFAAEAKAIDDAMAAVTAGAR
ncbi:MAG: DUF1802 family protein [Dehalococcoidia bacterium]